jgi:hypothetical protein
VTDKPVLFTGAMVRAWLDGRKGMTRRMLYAERKGRGGLLPEAPALGDYPPLPRSYLSHVGNYWALTGWHKVQPGDRLWVRENWRVSKQYDRVKPVDLPTQKLTVLFEAGGSIANHEDGWRPGAWPHAGALPDWAGKLRSAIHLPRWASRLTPVVTATKIERVQDISDADAQAEGARRFDDIPGTHPYPALDDRWSMETPTSTATCLGSARAAFGNYWVRLHGPSAWDENPWVVAITAKLHRCNIDKLEAGHG